MTQDQRLKDLIYLLRCYYHQDVWVDIPSHQHQDVWKDFVARDQKAINQLRDDVRELLAWEPEAMYKFYREQVIGGAHGLSLDNPAEAKKWLEDLGDFLTQASDEKQ